MKILGIAASVFALALISSADARAQDAYPSRPIQLVAPAAPGSVIDILARVYAAKLSPVLKQQIVVVNKPGAGGLLGAQVVAAAPPDGYTLMFHNKGLTIQGAMSKDFDPRREFTGVAYIGDTPTLVILSPHAGVRTLGEFIALAKAKPGAINYSSAGIGSAGHLAGSAFAQQTGISIEHVPYQQTSQILTDLLSGRMQALFAPLAFTYSYLKDGKLLALAVSNSEALNDPIDIPTARSLGVNFDFSTWYVFFAPAKTPGAIARTLHQAITKVGEDPELIEKVKGQGLTPRSMEFSAVDAFIRDDMEKLIPLVTELKLK